MHGRDPSIEGAILLSPPLHRATDADLDAWAAFGKPLVVLVPELDDYLRPDEARATVRARAAGGGHRRRRREAPVGRRVRRPAGARRDRRPRAARPPGPAAHHLDRSEHDRGGRRMSLHTYREDGDGLPLVLLHGFPLDHRMWDDVAAPAPRRPPRARRRPARDAGQRVRPAGAGAGGVRRPGRGRAAGGGRRAGGRRRPLDGRLRRARARSNATRTSSPPWRWWTPSRPPTPPRRAPTGCASRTRRRQSGSVDPVRPMASSLLGESTQVAPGRRSPTRSTAWIDEQEPAGDRLVAARHGGPAGPFGGAARVRRARRRGRRRRGHRHPRRGRRAPGRDVASRRGSSSSRAPGTCRPSRSPPRSRPRSPTWRRRPTRRATRASARARARAPATCRATRRPCRPHRCTSGGADGSGVTPRNRAARLDGTVRT